ncbi:MAG: hypothetical protein F4W95_07800 [Chloroflexi bacterium]|nr:hypothetical protein [Chloroflexota bacterium]MYD48374.1 hypothetical protein [Chloroflexota bacterium]
MPKPIIVGLLAGLIFGIVLIWQGAGAAGLVILFTLLGSLVGFVLWFGWRIYTGEIDGQTLRALIQIIFGGRQR